jgi:hypothetical protein
MALYIESPDGPLENQILGGVPVLADNWGFGIDELGRPYFDTGFASAGQQAYLRLIGGRVAIIGQSHSLGGSFEGAPMPRNPPARALNAGFVGRPLPPQLSAWGERERPARDGRPLPADPPGWYERERLLGDARPLPAMPPNRAPGAEFTGQPLPDTPANRGVAAGFTGTPLPPNAPSVAADAAFTGRPMPPNEPAPAREFTGRPLRCNRPGRAVAAGFTGRPMPSNPPARAQRPEFTGAPMPPMPANHAAFGPIERTSDG